MSPSVPTMKRIDFHAHLLPGVDDGAKDLDTAVDMIGQMEISGVHTVVATPHYFSLDETPDCFCNRVIEAYRTLQQHNTVHILLGAEVYLERNLLLSENLHRLCITDTDLLLIELPVSEYREWMYTQLTNLVAIYGIRPVIAHVERVLPRISKRDLNKLLEVSGICFQFNHSAFESHKATVFMRKLIKQGYPVFFGSDCHDVDDRGPTSKANYEKIERWLNKKLGGELMNQVAWMQQNALNLIEDR